MVHFSSLKAVARWLGYHVCVLFLWYVAQTSAHFLSRLYIYNNVSVSLPRIPEGHDDASWHECQRGRARSAVLWLLRYAPSLDSGHLVQRLQTPACLRKSFCLSYRALWGGFVASGCCGLCQNCWGRGERLGEMSERLREGGETGGDWGKGERNIYFG